VLRRTASRAKLVGQGAVKSHPVIVEPGQGAGVELAGAGNTALIGGPSDNSNEGAVWIFAKCSDPDNDQDCDPHQPD
jgi:hypothetical protein